MSTTPAGKSITINIDGSIGETTPFFMQKIDGLNEIILNMEKTSYINSIGVKHWIVWTGRIPAGCVVKIVNAPFVIASQASSVVGFVTKKITLESMRAPYACDDCGAEEIVLLKRGVEYDYPTPEKPQWVKLPEEQTCSKCRKTALVPDFFQERTFKFLSF